MSFSIQLTPDLITVEPGATTPVSVVIVNKGGEADRYELEIEGIDPEWTAVPVPVFAVESSESHTERVFFKPSRSSSSSAGNYPFVVRVRSLVSGESKAVQAVLEVKAFNHISMEISPKKGVYSSWQRNNTFSAVVVNLGNSEHTLQLTGSDPEDACAYEFESEQVSVAPGQQREVEFSAAPTSKPVFAGGRLIGFSVVARGIDQPSVVASAQAQLEQRPFLTPTGLILTVLVAAIIGLWYLMRPQPMQIVLFSVTPQTAAVKGLSVSVRWNVQQATKVLVTAGEDVIADGTEPAGNVVYQLPKSGMVDFKIVASREGQDKRQDIVLTVKEPEIAPDPEILSLDAKPDRVKLGSPFVLEYSFGSFVTRAVLEPTGQTLDPSLNRLEIPTTRSGDLEYTVSAYNKDGKSVKRSVKVSVYEESDATIIAFSPNSPSVPLSVGKVTLTWQVTGAVRVELAAGGGQPQKVDPSDSMEVPVTVKTPFTLTAYDARGRKTSQTKVVDVIPDIPPPPAGTTGTGTGAAGQGGTTGDQGGQTGGATGQATGGRP